jgi:hypothetical protein
MKSFKLTAFSVVFLYSEPIKGVDISDVKRALNLSGENKVVLIDAGGIAGGVGAGLLMFDDQKRVVFEINRILFTDSKLQDNNLSNLEKYLNPLLGAINKLPLKAYGFNYDIAVDCDANNNWQDFLSKDIEKIVNDRKVDLFGIKLALSDNTGKYRIDISSAEGGEKKSLLIKLNDHHEANIAPSSEALLEQARKGLEALIEIIKPILK